MSAETLVGPINDIHREIGASFADFGGWSMPVSYSGTVAEHAAVRERVGIFDVSHLGKASVAGPGAASFVNRCLTNDLAKIEPGRAQYTLCANGSGGVVDDLIAYWVSEEEVFLVPNAANTAAVVTLLAAAAPADITVVDRHREFGVLAVQGRLSAEVLSAVELPTEMGYMSFIDANITVAGRSRPIRVCRTGYTGERGFELLPRWEDTADVFEVVLAAVTAIGGLPAGLGARDTLRTEMGYPLHGHELSADITPLQARCGWAVGWKKPEFFGRAALLAERQAGPVRTLRGLRAIGRGVPRADCTVRASDGTAIGQCTSGTFSPTLKEGIALALIDSAPGIADGAHVIVDVRGRDLECELVTPPFVQPRTD